MIEINNTVLMTDVYDIVVELKSALNKGGINRFGKIIKSKGNIMTCCPFHKDGQEKKPSFGISEKDGTCHCFGCGWAGSLSEMVSNCFGYDDFGVYGGKWLIQNFLTVQIENRTDIDLDIARGSHKEKQVEYISEEELDSYRYIHPYMYKRKMTDEVIEIFDIGYDDKTQCITFPIRDINGNCLFVARRSVNTKYFNYPNSVEKPVYGLYEIKKEQFLYEHTDIYRNVSIQSTVNRLATLSSSGPKEIIICESMINAITCWVYGKYAVALNGTGTKYQYEQLRRMPNRKFILALDPDDAGNRGREKLKKALNNKIISEYIIPEGKDINDLSKDEFFSLQEVF